jgi:hypothetical protein
MNYNIDTRDWAGDYNAAEQNFIGPLKATTPQKSSFVPLSHDIHEETVNTLVPYMINNARMMGYTFTTVGQCLGDPESNWYRDPVTGEPVGDPLAVMNAKINGGNATQLASATATSTGGGHFGDASTPTVTAQSSVSASATASSLAQTKKNHQDRSYVLDTGRFSFFVGLVSLILL